MATDGVPARGWYYGWNVVAVCALAGIAPSILGINCFTLFLKDWSARLHAPVSTLQLGMALLGIGTALLSPFAGMLVDRYPARWLYACGLGAAALFSLAIGSVDRVWAFLALYALVLPVALTLSANVIANAVIARWFVRRLGLALAADVAGLGIVGILFPPLVAALLPRLGWQALWRIGAASTALVVLPLLLAVLRERPTEREGLHYVATAGPDASRHDAAPVFRLGDVLSRPAFWLLVAVYLPMLALFVGCTANIAPATALLGLGQGAAGLLLSLVNLSHVGSLLLIGLVSERLGNRLLLAGLAFGTAAGGLLFAVGTTMPVLALAVLLIGFGASFWPVLAAAIAREFGAGAVGRVFGLTNLFLPLGSFAPFAIARVQERTGSYAPALCGLSVLGGLTALACLLLLREREATTSMILKETNA